MKKLPPSFYSTGDVLDIAENLIGKVLVTHFNGHCTAGIITETEAYAGIRDKASHAYGDKRTSRTEVMYKKGGTVYVYLCYGIHSLFNIVTNNAGIPEAVLIRAIYPISGIEMMRKRRKNSQLALYRICDGPGKVCQALGIHYSISGTDLFKGPVSVMDNGLRVDPDRILRSKRIGVEYAGEDADLPYRFYMEASVIPELL